VGAPAGGATVGRSRYRGVDQGGYRWLARRAVSRPGAAAREYAHDNTSSGIVSNRAFRSTPRDQSMDARGNSGWSFPSSNTGASRARPPLCTSPNRLFRKHQTARARAARRRVHPDHPGCPLTAAGRSLVEPARQVLRDLTIARECHRRTRTWRGTPDVVAVPALAIDPLSRMVGWYQQPDFRVRARHLVPRWRGAGRLGPACAVRVRHQPVGSFSVPLTAPNCHRGMS
jgi:hypothetical protein